MSSDTVRIGIIAVGNMGSSHFKTISTGKVPGMTVSAIADRRPERTAKALQTLAGLREKGESDAADPAVFTEGSELIASGKCDAVIVSVPHYQHPGLSIDAMRHGLHVMC